MSETTTQPLPDFTETTCWADPLTRAERRELERYLRKWCFDFWKATTSRRSDWSRDLKVGLRVCMTDMQDLHLDVTERAEVAPR